MAVGTYALTTLAHLKSYLNLSVSTHDTLLEDFVDRATDLFENFTNRKLKARDYHYDSGDGDYDSDNGIMDGNDRDMISLPQYPVNSITTLRINTTSIDERTSIYACGWVIQDKAAGIVALSCYLFTKGLKNIDFAYNAGYSTVPEDLEQACIELAAWMFKQSTPGSALLGESSKSFPDGSISFIVKELLPQVKMVLEKYKKRFLF